MVNVYDTSSFCKVDIIYLGFTFTNVHYICRSPSGMLFLFLCLCSITFYITTQYSLAYNYEAEYSLEAFHFNTKYSDLAESHTSGKFKKRAD